MPKLNMTIPHSLTRLDALSRIRNRIDGMKKNLGNHVEDLREEWDGDTCRFGFAVRGLSVSGTLAVKDASVDLSANVPFAALMLKGRIEIAIRDQMDKLLV